MLFITSVVQVVSDTFKVNGSVNARVNRMLRTPFTMYSSKRVMKIAERPIDLSKLLEYSVNW